MKLSRKLSRAAAMILALCTIVAALSGCSQTIGMKIDGKSVPKGLYTYYYALGYSSYSDTTKASEYASQQIAIYYATEELCREYGVQLEALERKSVLDNITTSVEENMGGTSGYKKFLNAMSLSKKQFQNIMYNRAKQTKLMEYLYDAETGIEPPTKEECYELFCTYYCSAMHILISTQEAEGQEDYDAALSRAEEALARAKAGEDFSALIDEYGEDPGQDSKTGYIFTDGQMVDAFSDAAFALEPGEISDIVQTSYGYHIIKRNPITMEDYEQYHESFYSSVESYKFQLLINEKIESMNVVIDENSTGVDVSAALSYISGS